MKRFYFLFIVVGLSLMAFAPAETRLFKTSLTLIVRDDVGNTVAKAAVKLYEKEEDYLKEVNPAAEGDTDEKGVVKFKDLKAIPYYVLVRKDDKDNAGGGEQIGKLEEGKFNKATVVIQ